MNFSFSSKLTALMIATSLVSPFAFADAASEAKHAAAKELVAAQQAADGNKIASQLAGSAVQASMNTWGQQIEASVPKEKQKDLVPKLNAELEKYSVDLKKIIQGKTSKVNDSYLNEAFAAKFTVEEMKELKAFFDSASFKKYQASMPEIGNVYVQKLVEASKPEVEARAKLFNEAAAKIAGINLNATPSAAPKKK